jgi:hypothetical protein
VLLLLLLLVGLAVLGVVVAVVRGLSVFAPGVAVGGGWVLLFTVGLGPATSFFPPLAAPLMGQPEARPLFITPSSDGEEWASASVPRKGLAFFGLQLQFGRD